MTAERWAGIRQLYDSAQERPGAVREAFVREQAGSDVELCEETLAMLRNLSEDGGLLNVSLFGRQLVLPVANAFTLRPGQTLSGRYRVLRLVGAGGMGEVFEAEDIELGARVAIKTMRVEDADTLARFKREIQLARTVTHPNVCRIFDLHRHHDSESGMAIAFLTMELVEGETLTDYLARRGALTPVEALPIARQIGAALAAAHEKGVVHRDLKSGNVMLAEQGRHVVVTDFGLAQTLAHATDASVTVAGTPAYMAPEQFEGKPAQAAADIYAFGVLLYEMVVGRKPFKGGSLIALALEKIRSEPPWAADTVPSLPPVWNSAIRRMMEPVPARRFADVRDAVELLEGGVARKPLIRLSRRRKRMAAGFLLVGAAAGLAAWRYTQSFHAPPAEALRLYRQGAHARQLEFPWKATQFYEQALAKDGEFIAARAALAEAWMDLDVPGRAADELKRAAANRPHWQRVPDYEALLEQAARARLRGDVKQAASLHQRASSAAPDSEKPDLLMGEAMADVQAGATENAIAVYAALEKPGGENGVRCAAMMAHADLTLAEHPVSGRLLFGRSQSCFEAAGDLDGVAQAQFDGLGPAAKADDGVGNLEKAKRALSIAKTTGNVEQEILAGAWLSTMMLRMGEDDDAYNAFSQSMQVADRNGVKFMTARLLSERAEYYFDQGDFLQFDYANQLASAVSRSAAMPWTVTACQIRGISELLRMGLPNEARASLRTARERLRLFPNAALSARLAELEIQANQTQGRPEAK